MQIPCYQGKHGELKEIFLQNLLPGDAEFQNKKSPFVSRESNKIYIFFLHKRVQTVFI